MMLGEVDRALAFLTDLEKSYTIMSTKTGELHQVRTQLLFTPHLTLSSLISHTSTILLLLASYHRSSLR